MRQYILLIKQADNTEQKFQLPTDGATLGSDNDNNIVLSSRDIEPHHIKFIPEDDGIVVESLEDSTFHLAGGDATSALLTPGETIQVGPYSITCELIIEETKAHEPKLEPTDISEWARKLEEPIDIDEELPVHTSAQEDELDISEEPEKNKFDENMEDTDVHEQKLLPKLILLSGISKEKEYNLTRQDQFIIGRSDDADINIEDLKMSRHHAEIFFEDNRFYIKDMESANGTFVNGQPIATQELNSGDSIEIGDSKIQFLLVDESTFEVAKTEPSMLPVPAGAAGGGMMMPQYFTPEMMQPQQTKKTSPLRRLIIYAFVGVALYAAWHELSKKDDKRDMASVKEETAAPQGLLSEEQQAQRDALMDKAIALYNNRDYESALQNLNKVLTLNPSDTDAQKLAQSAAQAIQAIEAEREQRAMKLEGELLDDQVNFYLTTGMDYMNKGDNEKAEESFLKVLELDPGNSEGERRLKLARAGIKTAPERDIASITPEGVTTQAENLLKNGQERYQEGKYQEAINQWNEVLRIEGANMLPYYRQAELKIENAEKILEQEYAPMLNQAKVLLDAKEYKAAKEQAEKLLSKDPSHAEAEEIVTEIDLRLHESAKALYTEAVIDESLGYLDKAKSRFNEIRQTVSPEDEYYSKATTKLRKYPQMD